MIIILSVLSGLVIGYIARETIYKKKLPSFLRLLKTQGSHLQTPSLLEDKMQYESELEFVFKLNETLLSSLQRQMVVQHIAEAAYNFLAVERCVLLLWQKDTRRLSVGCALGCEQGLAKNIKDEDCISRFVIQQRQPLVINDLKQEHYFDKMNKEEYLKKSFVSVPLVFQEEVLGVLHVCDRKSGALFTKSDVSFVTNIARMGALALKNARMHEEIQEDYLGTITALALAVDARDSYTRHHSENVTKYSVAIAQKMQCSHYEIETIERAALLHDIGKIGVKDSILLKDGRLTTDEFDYVKLHPAKGEEIVKILPFLKDASFLIRHHHERYDGLGYPDGIKGSKIELGARILAVADAFDAMTTERPYRNALSAEEALRELERYKGTQFDPKVVECLQEVISQGLPVQK
jgi:HD-GYP domain-containing protein (c-di-GMP phosphodiesterase class II)